MDLLMSIAAIISIFIILGLFAFGSVVVKKFSNNDAGLAVYSGNGGVIDSVSNYMVRYNKLVLVEFLLNKGNSLESAISEAKYEG